MNIEIQKYFGNKGDTPNWSEYIFMIKKVRNTVPWSYVIIHFNGEEIFQTFY